MGVTIYNTKQELHMTYGTFNDGRDKISELIDPKLAQLRRTGRKAVRRKINDGWDTKLLGDFSEFINWTSRLIDDLIEEDNIDPDIIHFLDQPDTKGKINYKTCKKILDLIKDYDGRLFQPEAEVIPDDIEGTKQFKEMLQYCYSHRANLYWG